MAHVDAGKTSMAEAMLYKTGAIRQLGRVDHKDAFLDTQRLERRRGITIFSKQAIFDLGDTRVTLLDTPGHMDFSAEMERTLSVLDYAILVISGPDGVQAHTATVWALLQRYQVPTFLWINKMDLVEAAGPDERGRILQLLQGKLSPHCIDMTAADAAETMALADEAALDEFLADGKLSKKTVQRLAAERKIFPCWFGSALKLDGVQEFLDGMAACIRAKQWPADTRGRVFKITRADDGTRLTWMKLTGGSLKVRSEIATRLDDGEEKSEKQKKKRKHDPNDIDLRIRDVRPYTYEGESGVYFLWTSKIGFGCYTLSFRQGRDMEDERDRLWVADSEGMDDFNDEAFGRKLLELWMDQILVIDEFSRAQTSDLAVEPVAPCLKAFKLADVVGAERLKNKRRHIEIHEGIVRAVNEKRRLDAFHVVPVDLELVRHGDDLADEPHQRQKKQVLPRRHLGSVKRRYIYLWVIYVP